MDRFAGHNIDCMFINSVSNQRKRARCEVDESFNISVRCELRQVGKEAK